MAEMQKNDNGKITDEYMQFKYLLKRFVEIGEKNIRIPNKKQMERDGKDATGIKSEKLLGENGFEDNKYSDDGNKYSSVEIGKVKYNTCFCSGGTLGPRLKTKKREAGTGIEKIPYIESVLESFYNIRFTANFYDYAIKKIRVSIYNYKSGNNVPKPEDYFEYDVEKLDLDSGEPNAYLKELYNKRKELEEKFWKWSKRMKLNEQKQKISEFAMKLEDSKNLIFRGAPGTGKTYMARNIATYIVSGGDIYDYKELIKGNHEKKELLEKIEFVQFHPSYDYTDFVEGLRPITKEGKIGFKLKDGTFKKFCDKAREYEHGEYYKNYEKNHFEASWGDLLRAINEDKQHEIPDLNTRKIEVKDEKIRLDYKTGDKFFEKLQVEKCWRDEEYLFGEFHSGEYPIKEAYGSLLNLMKEKYKLKEVKELKELEKRHVFIIDEINRGEISKIFGELFFSIDPGYRGPDGEVSTQYSNMNEKQSEKFYVPENVYIIGTMNDIDRSVDTFDFAMRRRFTFMEITADESQTMLKRKDVKGIMDRLNIAILCEGLPPNYQIGAAYFLDLDKNYSKSEQEGLWNNKLKPLLEEYFRGEREIKKKMERIEIVYMGGNEVVEKVYVVDKAEGKYGVKTNDAT